MKSGHISKIVTTFGSNWGKIRLDGQTSEVFFNPDSLERGGDFASLWEGQAVQFDEEPDRANGMRAVRLLVASP